MLEIRENVGLKNIARVVHRLLQKQAKDLATADAVFSDQTPAVLTGRPLSGKTYLIKQKLLPFLKDKPVLIIDVCDEYTDLRNIGYDLYALDFKDFNEHIRFVPNKQSRVAETEIENIFAHLDMKRDELSKWIIIVEEAHSYKNIGAFTKFLYCSRHIVRKMIAITPQTDAYQGLTTFTIFH